MWFEFNLNHTEKVRLCNKDQCCQVVMQRDSLPNYFFSSVNLTFCCQAGSHRLWKFWVWFRLTMFRILSWFRFLYCSYFTFWENLSVILSWVIIHLASYFDTLNFRTWVIRRWTMSSCRIVHLRCPMDGFQLPSHTMWPGMGFTDRTFSWMRLFLFVLPNLELFTPTTLTVRISALI